MKMKRSSFLKSLAAAVLFPTSALASGVKKYPMLKVPEGLTPIKPVIGPLPTITMMSGEPLLLGDIVVVRPDGLAYRWANVEHETIFGVVMFSSPNTSVVEVYSSWVLGKPTMGCREVRCDW
jgi:hypothetical protein